MLLILASSSAYGASTLGVPGGVTVGNPTTGSCSGAGGLNAQSLCVNGLAVTPGAYLSSSVIALGTTAQTEYFLPLGTNVVTTTEATAEIAAPFAHTFTSIRCYLTVAEGSSASDAFSFLDITTACATALTCTSTNALNCNSTSGSCVVSQNDVIVMRDVDSGTLTARGATCYVY